MKRTDIKDNHIEVTTVKTADSIIIEPNKHSKAILDKYKNIISKTLKKHTTNAE